MSLYFYAMFDGCPFGNEQTNLKQKPMLNLPQSELEDCRVYGAADDGQVAADGELSLVPEVAADEVHCRPPESLVERDEEGGVDEGVHKGHVPGHLVRRRRSLSLVIPVTATSCNQIIDDALC